jgi:hypothetical protein
MIAIRDLSIMVVQGIEDVSVGVNGGLAGSLGLFSPRV